MRDRCYRRDYQDRHDIDWFAIYKGIPVHVASNGGLLPKQIKKNRNKQLQSMFASEELGEREVSVEEGWVRELQRRRSEEVLGTGVEFNVETYLQSFLEFASKGFVSIDNAIIDDQRQYVVVAYPQDRAELLKMEEKFLEELNLPEIPDEALQNINIENLWR